MRNACNVVFQDKFHLKQCKAMEGVISENVCRSSDVKESAWCEYMSLITPKYVVLVLSLGSRYHNQSSRKCCSAAAPLRAEQGPCEPSEDVVRKFGEQ